MLEIKDRKIAVIGLGKRTGVATARMLARHGARVVVSDLKGPEQLTEERQMLADYTIEYDLNGHGHRSLDTDLMVVSPGVPLDIPFFKEAEDRGIPVISEIELAYQFTEARIIAITGTNGKTTTTSLLGKMLQQSFPGRVSVAGNIGVPLIKEAGVLESNDWLVAEVSSFQLETIQEFRPCLSLFLNFSPDHLDRHPTVEDYWQAKKRIFENQQPGDLALINFDDSMVVRAARDCQARKLAVSQQPSIKDGVLVKDNLLYFRDQGKTTYKLSLNGFKLPGIHNRKNAAFATLAARLAGSSWDNIQQVLVDFQPIAHRLEEVKLGPDDILFIDDSKATNPHAAIKGITAFDRPIVLLAGGQDRNADFRELASVIKDRVKSLILLGETREMLARAVADRGFSRFKVVSDMEEAIKQAIQELEAGDCLLLSPGCPSWDMYENYRKRGQDFRNQLGKYYK
ncbi:MAG: UDP-N-acetylmuramoyl-L-alanine--D-glutamate ligase [Bacillota bacterium]